ncbi:MAG: protein translocase subunit SecF [Patescibacteria group bacterium]
MIHIIKTRRIWLILSSVLFVVAVAALCTWGLKFGVDFTGGSIMEISYSNTAPTNETIHEKLSSLELGEIEARRSGEQNVILRFKNVDQTTHQKILEALKPTGEFTEKSFDSIGPVIGKDLRNKSLWAIVIALALILAYLSFVFRKVSHSVASWKYGAVAIVGLLHDIVLVAGVFAVLGKFAGVEVTASFIAAFLTILGFSVHNTIVVFDRSRENLLKRGGNFEEVVEYSVNQTLGRSINTSLTVLLVMTAVYFFGGESIRNFTLVLILGVLFGTYSSIFVASPLLVVWHNITKGRRAHKK